MRIIDCETWRLSVVLVSMTIFGQNVFLEGFHNDSPNISLEYDDIQSIEHFFQVEILEKQWRFECSNLSRKVAWLPWQHT